MKTNNNGRTIYYIEHNKHFYIDKLTDLNINLLNFSKKE